VTLPHSTTSTGWINESKSCSAGAALAAIGRKPAAKTAAFSQFVPLRIFNLCFLPGHDLKV
jgi:hypothetical protein